MHFQAAVVIDESQLAEAVHEEVHTRAGGADHLREHFLTDFRDHGLRLAVLAEMREQQENPCQALLAGVKELIDDVRLDPGVSREQEGDENIGERVFLVKHTNLLWLLNPQHRAAGERGGGGHPDALGGGYALLTDEVAGVQQGEGRLFPLRRQDCQF